MKTNAKGMSCTELVGVPVPVEDESPSSWLSRAALSQGVSTIELRNYLGASVDWDFDLVLDERLATVIDDLCQVPASKFDHPLKVLGNLKKIDRRGRRFLMTGKKVASSWYCPLCLDASQVKYFKVHWRLNLWRYCAEHDCELLAACHACKKQIEVPFEMLSGGPRKMGVAYLDRCMRCGSRLGENWMPTTRPFDPDLDHYAGAKDNYLRFFGLLRDWRTPDR